ncbi:unnamed protein product, partial [Prorocentrum cordatum]
GSGRPSDAEASDRRRRQALHSAGERAGEAGLMIRAEQWLSALIGEDLFSPDVVSYNTVIHAYARTGNVDRAEFWLQQMVKANLVPNEVTMGSLINACAEAGKLNRAERILEAMTEDHHLKPNDICYNAVIKACVNCRSFQRAEVWMLRMRREGFALTPMTYNLFIHGCAQAGDLTLADKYLNEMIKEGCEANRITFNLLLNLCANRGEVERAEACLHHMVSCGLEPDQVGRDVGNARAGDFEKLPAAGGPGSCALGAGPSERRAVDERSEPLPGQAWAEGDMRQTGAEQAAVVSCVGQAFAVAARAPGASFEAALGPASGPEAGRFITP